MKLIVFSKMLQEKSVAELIELAQRHGYDGYDLAVRPGHPVNPDNAAAALPQAQAQMEQAGLQIGMVTGNFDLLTADHPLAEPLLAAMDSANVRLLKLGYFKFEPQTMDYWEQVDNVRRAFAAWEKLASIYNVKICYHTHSHYCMGLNAAALMHLLRDFDPAYLGAYLDPGHFAVDGEPFDFGLAMARQHLSILSVKDVLIERVARRTDTARPKRSGWPPARGSSTGRPYSPNCAGSSMTVSCRFTASMTLTTAKIGSTPSCARWPSSAR